MLPPMVLVLLTFSQLVVKQVHLTGGSLLVDAPTVHPGSQSVSEAIPCSEPPTCVEMASGSAPGAPDTKAP